MARKNKYRVFIQSRDSNDNDNDNQNTQSVITAYTQEELEARKEWYFYQQTNE